MTDLFIHIGAPKTGTTAIQHFLLRNRADLARQGVLYPSGGMLGAAHHVVGAAVFPGRSSRLGSVSRNDALNAAVEEIRGEISNQRPHTVILSTEYLWGELSSPNIRRLLQPFSDFSIKIVAYVRRQDLLAQSLYVQAVKGGLAESFAAWLERAIDGEKAGFDFHKVLTSWQGSGITTEIVVRVYERSQLDGDICADFLATVHPRLARVPPTGDRIANTGPDRTTVELLRLVNAKLEDRELASKVRRRILAQTPPRPPFAPLNYLRAADAVMFMNRFAKQNAAVARDFLHRPDGVLFRDQLPTDRDNGSVEDAVPREALERLVDLLPLLIGLEHSDTETKRSRLPAARRSEKRREGIASL